DPARRTRKRLRPCDQHEHHHDENAADPMLAHEVEIDLGTEKDEHEHTQDERGGHHVLIELARLAGLHREAERLLVSQDYAEGESGHKAAGLQPVRGEGGAAIKVTTGPYSASNPHRSWAVSKEAK